MPEIGVGHLVRARNGIEPFRRFLDSYAQCRGGVAHDLLVIFKGFKNSTDAEPFRKQLEPFGHKEIFISDLGFDLRAYAMAARHFNYTRLCFLNSFSVLLDENWLAKLNEAANQPGVGLAGATGSYESMYSSLLAGLAHTKSEGTIFPSYIGRPLHVRLNSLFFHPFPNPHIRTTAFMLKRELMLKVWPQTILTKKGAYLFENGKNSFTRRVLAFGQKAIVVGKDGRAYEKEEWVHSNTFRHGDQANLLVADNQTRQYANADFETRLQLSRLSWGDQADPGKP